MRNFFVWTSLMVLFTATAQAEVPKRWEKLLKEIVDMNSSTQNPSGLDKVRARLIPEFESLGFKTQILEAGENHKVVSFRFKDAKPKILLVGHVDTVFPKDSTFQRLSENEQFIVGPGVNDMKGGIVLMLAALNEIKDEALLKQIAVVLNDDEEIGSPKSAPLLKQLANGIEYGLVYEPTMASANHVTTSQAGVSWLEIKVVGKAAHAGAEHPKGINACVELAHKITKISLLTSYKNKLTVNPGVIQGGTMANVVCEQASVKIDIRYVEEKDLIRTKKAIERIVSSSTVYNKLLKRGPESSMSSIVEISSLAPKTAEFLFQKASVVAKAQGYKLMREHIGGASDANQLAPTGMKLLSGLGPWGSDAHSVEEKMDKKSFDQRMNLSVGLIKSLLSL